MSRGAKLLMETMLQANCEAMLESFESDHIDAALMALEDARQVLLQRAMEIRDFQEEQPQKQITLDV